MNSPGWKAGAAAIDITPGGPMWLAGWAARREPARNAAMSLCAKALAFEDDQGQRAVIVTADLIAIPRTLAEAVAARVRTRWALPRERILFNASHTHTAPEVRPDKVPFFEIPAEFAAKIPTYVTWLEGRISAAIDAAMGNLAPVTLRAHEARVEFAANRRSPPGPVDHDVPVLAVSDARGKARALLFGYACHNLTLPLTYCAYHGDYAGVAQAELAQKLPGCIAMFLAGAGADQDPAPRGSVEHAAIHGHALAGAIGEALAAHGRVIAPGLAVAYEDLELDLQPLPPMETLQADARSDDAPLRRKARYLLAALTAHQPLATKQRVPVQVIRFGHELLLIALGGEPVIDFALRFKEEFGGPMVWVAGYSNDMFGYLPTRRVQQQGGYEAGRAALWSAVSMPVAESSEDRVVQTVRRLVSALR